MRPVSREDSTGRRRTHSSTIRTTALRGSHDSDDRRKHRGPAAPSCAASETASTNPVAAGVHDAAVHAVQRSTDFLLSTQDAEGWWKGDLETNVTMDAEDLLLRQFLGILDEATAQAAALFIRGEQREDGAWATFYGGPGELSATIEAYVALRLAA